MAVPTIKEKNHYKWWNENDYLYNDDYPSCDFSFWKLLQINTNSLQWMLNLNQDFLVISGLCQPDYGLPANEWPYMVMWWQLLWVVIQLQWKLPRSITQIPPIVFLQWDFLYDMMAIMSWQPFYTSNSLLTDLIPAQTRDPMTTLRYKKFYVKLISQWKNWENIGEL